MTHRLSRATAGAFLAGSLLLAPFLASTTAQAAPAGSDPTPTAPDAAQQAPALPTSGQDVQAGNEVAPLATENVGGGTWNHGTNYNTGGGKNCYSHYVHPNHQHTATAIIGSSNVRVSARPGAWAFANAAGGAFDTCSTYWNVI